ncbi:MAG: BREX-3 system P-loop-containing protein BrxF [Clostridiales bacterium]|nr:BREX-3 system P-loop-containing protein BrxF [Clostridiales bacterium]
MGVDATLIELENLWSIYNHYSAIATIDTNIVIEYFREYTYISLGAMLSHKLLQYDRDLRKKHVIEELDGIFCILDSQRLLIDDIDILFNPTYDIDILGYFVKLGRNRRIIVNWPGEYSSGYLIYALPGYEDYKIYRTKNYNVICIV